MTVLAEVFLLVGAAFMLLAGIGVLRMPDVVTRMHPASKTSTLGLLLMLVGTALAIRRVDAVTEVVLVAAFALLTTPVAAHLVGRAAYRSLRGPEHDAKTPAGDVVDGETADGTRTPPAL